MTLTSPTTYINGSDPTSYPVNASTPDGDVTHVDFFECSNASAACSTGSWIPFGTDNASPYSALWSTPAFDGPKAIRAVAYDIASNNGEDVRTITIDRTAPSGVTVGYPNGYVSGSFAITTNNGPDSDVDGSSGLLERQVGDLANDSCSSYGGFGPASSPDTLASAKCARYRYSVADNAGNVAVATSPNQAKSDTDAPASAEDDPGANLRQTVVLTSSASDTGGSTVASVAFQRRPAGGGPWTTIGADTTAPYSFSFDTTTVADGLYDLRSVATDKAGNDEISPVVVANRRIDNTAPSATMLSPGNPVSGAVALTSTTNDAGSGIASVSYELAPNGGSFNSQPASWDTTLNADGLYDLRVIATDVAGNSTTSALVTTRVDNTAPALTFSSPANNAAVSGTVNLVASASDASPASPPVSFAYKLHSDPPSSYASTGASWNTTTLPAGDGLYDLRAQATDAAGNTPHDRAHEHPRRQRRADRRDHGTGDGDQRLSPEPDPVLGERDRSGRQRHSPGRLLPLLRPEHQLRHRRVEPARHDRGSRPVQRLVEHPGHGRQPLARRRGHRQRGPPVERDPQRGRRPDLPARPRSARSRPTRPTRRRRASPSARTSPARPSSATSTAAPSARAPARTLSAD